MSKHSFDETGVKTGNFFVFMIFLHNIMELKPYARSPTRPTKRELQVVDIFLWKTGTHLPHKFDTITADELVIRELIRELSAVA